MHLELLSRCVVVYRRDDGPVMRRSQPRGVPCDAVFVVRDFLRLPSLAERIDMATFIMLDILVI